MTVAGAPAVRKVDRQGNPLVIPGTVRDPAMARRYLIQRHAQLLLSHLVGRVDRWGQERAHYKFRVAMCCRGTNGRGQGVLVYRSPDRSRARFENVQTCGSVWHCPLCAPKVGADRRDEMNKALYRWMKGWQGRAAGRVYLVTFTMQHKADRFGQGHLVDQIAELAAALRALKGSRAYRELLEAAGTIGGIRGLEVKYGELNGWHCHTHELVFAAADQDARLARGLRKLWARELIKRNLAGLLPGDTGEELRAKLRALLARCVTVRNGSYAADYIAKFGREPERERTRWGLGAELTHSHLKTRRATAGADGELPARCKHASPWEMLNDAVDGDSRSADLFIEYAEAMHGRRQLYWSRGLKEFFELVDVADEEIAAKPDQRCTDHVIELGNELWAIVLRADARARVLQVAAEGGYGAVVELLAELQAGPADDVPYFTTDGTVVDSSYIPSD